MERFEYMEACVYKDDIITILNEYGKDGWQLIEKECLDTLPPFTTKLLLRRKLKQVFEEYIPDEN